MTKLSLSETLKQMAGMHESRSETDRLRDVYADIEMALQSGVSRKAVLEVLHKDGFAMSLKMFDKALYRIRKAKRSNVTTKCHADEHRAGAIESETSTDQPPLEKPVTWPRKPMTPADFREIRNQPHDWVALSKPVIKK
ncbi:hypothetical protein [Pseudomonas sp. BRG-100]|uniref:hypothetical protein n=1 Tax=Pseudomonas sp. BRG-100 TaxID=1524267 RepID=UPI0006AD0325|nr:hypothetical protein [Pseudomonas sp. BRG-100]